MEQIDRDWAREILDSELYFAFARNKWEVAYVLLSYAKTIDVIDKEEHKYLSKAIRCLN